MSEQDAQVVQSNEDVRLKNLVPLAKGYDPRRNIGGRTKSKIFSDKLREVLYEVDEVKQMSHLELITRRLVLEAERGEQWAQEMVWNRMEGSLGEEDNTGNRINVVVIRDGSQPLLSR